MLAVSILNGGGLGYVGNGGGGPPDVTGAAGPNSYLEITNSTVTLFNKPNGTILAQNGINDFFYSSAIGNQTPIYSQNIAIAASPTGDTEAGNTVTITTVAPHGFIVGQTVAVSGVGVAGYNGVFKITAVTATTFTYTNPTSGLADSGGGTVSANSCLTCDSTGLFDNLMGADGRFVIADIDIDDVRNVSQYLLAVSTSSSPTTFTTADWNFYHVTTTEDPGPAGTSSWTDYPGNPGFNEDAFVTTFNMFGNGPSAGNAQIVSINAADLANGVPQASLNVFRNDQPGFNYRPTTMHDAVAGGPMWLIRDPNTGTSVDVVSMTNVLSNAAVFATTSLALPAANNFPTAGINNPLNPDSSPMNDVGRRILKAAENNQTIVATETVPVGTASVASATVALDGAGNPIGGTGYTVGDSLTLNGGTGTAATLTVTTLGAGGSVATVTVANPGNYSSLAGLDGTVTGGTGNGAKFNLIFRGELDVQWYAIDVSGPAPDFQQVAGADNVGRIGFGANTYSVEAAIDINASGQIGLGFMESDTVGGAINGATGGFLSTFVTARNPTDPAGTMQPVLLVPAGTGSGNINGRIGDFSGMNVDPVNDTFWHVNEFGGAGGPTDIANFALFVFPPGISVTNGVMLICGDVDSVNENDTFKLERNAADPTMIDIFRNDPGPAPTFSFPLSGLTKIALYGGGGNNTLIVDSTNGLINVAQGIDWNAADACPGMVAGEDGFNQTILQQSAGASAPTLTTDVYTVGPTTPGNGMSVVTDTSGNVQTVNFFEVSPTFDFLPVPTLTVNATNADNAINYTTGKNSFANFFANPPVLNTNWGEVSIDNQEPIEFINKTNLVINSLAGSDEINLNNPNTPTGLTAITVNGGDPTASDLLIANGTAAVNTITFTPTGADVGSITGAGPVPINFTTTEHVTINGQGGADVLTYQSPAGGSLLNFTPGATVNSGLVTGRKFSGNGGEVLVPMNYVNIDHSRALAQLIFANVGGHVDDLVLSGSTGSDIFTVLPNGGNGSVLVENGGGIPDALTHTVDTRGILNISLKSQGGDDSFNLTGTLPYTKLVVDADATVNLSGAAGPVTVFIGDNTPGSANPDTVITGYGASVVLIGVDTANLDANGNQVTATGTTQNDNIIYTPTGAVAGTFYDDIGSGNNLVPNTVFNIANVSGNFRVFNDPAGNADQVTLRGTAARDLIQINQGSGVAQVLANNVTALLPVQLGQSVEILTAQGLGGQDTFQVIPAPGLAGQAQDNLLINVDGGDSGENNALVIAASFAGVGGATTPLAANQFVVVNKNATPNSGTVRVFTAAIANPDINYQSVQVVSPNVAGTSLNPNLLVMGPDLYEQNEQLGNAAFLGADSTLQVQHATIFPSNTEFPGVPADNDNYRVVAQVTGTLDFQVYFRTFNPALLPGGGQINLQAFDAAGNLIAAAPGTFGADPGTGNARIRIPAVAGQTYYLRVFGATAATVNGYDITIIDTAPPVPYDLELDDVIATSSVTGNISFTVVDQHFNGGAALSTVNDFYNGKDVYFTEGNLNGQRGRVVDYVGATRTFIFAVNTFSTALGALAVGDDFQIESVDTGRSQLDNITRDNTPTIYLRLDDGIFLHDLPGNGSDDTPPAGVIPIPFRAGPAQPVLPGYAIAIFDEGSTPPQVGTPPQTPIGFAIATAQEGVYVFTATTPLSDGSHFLTSRVQMIDPAIPQRTGFGARSVSLEIVVDTAPPPVFFGLPNDANDGLLPGSDSGVNTNPETLNDLVTNVTNPGFFGQAEADAVIRLFIDAPEPGFPTGNGIFEPAIDFQIGFDVAKPYDGTNQYPNGYWQVDAVNVNLNAPPFSPIDGLRRIFVTAEDVAGNINSLPGAGVVQQFEIFIDTQGPQITDVEINNPGNPYDLFDPKPSNDGPTPLVQSIVISVQDLPLRTPTFLVPAIKADIAENPGHYLLKGDYNGIIPILDVVVTNNPVPNPAPLPGNDPLLATATIELIFWDFGPDGTPFTLDDVGGPLPDDRFTLFVNDEGIIDRAGNILDGESNADEPHDQDALDPEILGVDGFPSGDGLPGGDFLARFTIDSVAEVGTWGAGSAWVDTNGNTSFDPTNLDFTNRDITYILGFTSDDLFAGNFALGPGDIADGFDKLAAYGRVNGVWRWLVDTDNDGVPNVNQPDPAGINGLPVAGNFDGDATNGDEVGIFTGTTWWFDTNHDFQVDTSLVVASNFVGYPVVGDFDGDGLDDLGAWTDDRFKFDLASDGLDGAVDAQFRFGFPGANERPVAADVNGDGIDDIGLFVPNRASAAPDEAAEWYILVSGEVQNNGDLRPGDVVPEDTFGPTILDRIVLDPIDGQQIVRFTTEPFGRDIYLHYGDEFSLPIIGNFDPPVGPANVDDLPSSGNNTRDSLDVNNDGIVSAIDALLVINHLNRYGSTPVTQGAFTRAPFLDVSNNSQISASDALLVINRLNAQASSLVGAEGEADEFFSSQASADNSQLASDDVLALLANDQENQRRKG